MLKTLWEATQRFYERFDIFPPQAEQTVVKFEEEAREYTEALRRYDAHPTEDNRQSVLDELGDIGVTAFVGPLMARGWGIEDIETALLKVTTKNSLKTHTTHFKDVDGFVKRRK